MKKRFFASLAAACMLLPIVCAPTATAEGRLTVEFEENAFAQMFDVYTEAEGDRAAFTVDGFLISTGRSENKALLKSPAALSSFTVEADFYPIDGDVCQFSSGFYIYASNANNALDGITAYNVAIERDYAMPSAALRIHRFDQGYKGVVAETSVALKRFPVGMKVVADNGRVRVYVYDDPVAVLDTVLPNYKAGRVGFRTFRGNAGKIGNFRLTADEIDADTTALYALIAEAEKIDAAEYTQATAVALTAALDAAKTAVGSNSQAVIDNACRELEAAVDGLTKSYSYQDLQALIVDAEKETAKTGVYTTNSIGSLRSVLARAKAVTETAAEDELSDMAQLLSDALDGLIRYIK